MVAIVCEKFVYKGKIYNGTHIGDRLNLKKKKPLKISE